MQSFKIMGTALRRRSLAWARDRAELEYIQTAIINRIRRVTGGKNRGNITLPELRELAVAGHATADY